MGGIHISVCYENIDTVSYKLECQSAGLFSVKTETKTQTQKHFLLGF